MNYKSGLIVTLTLGLQIVFAHQNLALAASEFSVYCSSNMDGTGICTKEGTSERLDCIVLQGSIVGCENSGNRYRCVQYGQIIANQTQFSCKETDFNAEKSLSTQTTKSSNIPTPFQSNIEVETGESTGDSYLNPFEQSPPIPQSNVLEDVY